jgi:hypothetical protein
MRIARLLCALFLILSCIPVIASAQRDGSTGTPRDPAFPPAAPGPLYFPRDEPPRFTPADSERPLRDPSVPEEIKSPLLDLRDVPEPLRLAQPPRGDDGFKPISELPPEDKLPAAPMLVAAYVFVVVALFAYIVSLSRRLNAVSRDIVRIDAQLKQR